MDPVLLPRLFDVIDQLVEKSGPVTRENLNLEKPLTKRRFIRVGRVLESFQVARVDGESLVPDVDMNILVEYWEDANLEGINTIFRRYTDYNTFLDYLKTKESIYVPPCTDPEERQEMGRQLRRNNTKLTFVAIDTFKWWGLAVGQVYLSHIGNRKIYWGAEKPNLDIFEKSIHTQYKEIQPLDGFVNIGRLADLVCRDLKISFIRFEELFVQLCLQRSGYMTSTSLARTPSSKSMVQTLLPRSQAKQGGKQNGWIKKRFMEDGVLINGRSAKMVKLEPTIITDC